MSKAMQAFRELLMETKTINDKSHSMVGEEGKDGAHMAEIVGLLNKDKRYTDLDCAADERTKILMQFLEDMERRGDPAGRGEVEGGCVNNETTSPMSIFGIALHQALSTYDGRRQELVNVEVTKLRDATNLMNELLSSKNLPAAVEATKGDEIPQSVRDKAKAVADAGGMTALRNLIDELPELLTRNTDILDECERMLKEERESDEQLKAQYMDKWNRTPSGQLTGTFNTNATKYRSIINKAKAADSMVLEKLDKHRECFDILSCGPTGLQSAIPVGKLRELMEAVNTIKAERHVIESKMMNTKEDMKPVFYDALARNSVIPEQEISVASLERCYGPLQKQANNTIGRQENVMKEVQELQDKFVTQTGCNLTCRSARDEMMKNLAAAHDAFFELRGNLQEGTKFYNDLTQLLITFQNKVNDFCLARKTEKEELMQARLDASNNVVAYDQELDPVRENQLVREWQEKMGPGYQIVVAQLSKPAGGLGIRVDGTGEEVDGKEQGGNSLEQYHFVQFLRLAV